MGKSNNCRPLGMLGNNSAQPSANRILEEKRQEFLKRLHEEKVASARARGTGNSNALPKLDTRPPTFYPHVHNNAKKMYQEEDRYTEIELENKHLLEKLSHIAKSTPSYRAKSATTGFRPGLRLDSNQRPTIDMGEPTRSPPKSLNAGRRKQELIRIMEENQAILSRIQMGKAVYSSMNWGEEVRKQEDYLANCSRMPRAGSYRTVRDKAADIAATSPVARRSPGFATM